MESIKNISLVFLTMLLLISCGQPEGKENITTPEKKIESETEVPASKGIQLEQKADYTNLYSYSTRCKLTMEELAVLYDITTDNIKETFNGPSGERNYLCSYHLNLKDETETVFSLTFFTRSRDDVETEISNWLSGTYEKKFLSISNSGDHYIWKHPNQGYFILHNPNYSNGIKVQYRTMLKTDETQAKFLEQKGIQAIDYIIDKYKN